MSYCFTCRVMWSRFPLSESESFNSSMETELLFRVATSVVCWTVKCPLRTAIH